MKKKTIDAPVIFFIQKKEINGATSYYIELLQKAFRELRLKYIHLESLKGYTLEKDQLIITITLKSAIYAILMKKSKRVIHWYQGIVPEEIIYLYPNSLWGRIKFLLYRVIESYVLSNAALNLFVSNAMKKHYGKQYKYQATNYLIIPCYNQNLCTCLENERYNKPTFVFAGNLGRWQCIEKTLTLYKRIEEQLPNAFFSFLTPEIEEAQKLLKKHNIHNYKLEHIQLSDFQKELQKHKYGFLIRDDLKLNNVATPTKMSSYMGNGIIPIFSDVIDDFKSVFAKLKYKILIDKEETEEDIVNKIINFEKDKIRAEDIINDYRYYFDTYFNDDIHVLQFITRMKELYLV